MGFLDKIKGARGLLYKEIQSEMHKNEPEENIRKFFIKKPSEFINISNVVDPTRVNTKYPLLEPFAFAHVRWDALTHQVVYTIVEPKMDEDDEKIYKKLVEGLVELVDVELSRVKKIESAIQYLEDQVSSILKSQGIKLTHDSYLRIMYYVYRNFLGLNELEPLMHDPYIEDIGGDGLNTPVYIVHKYFGSIRTNIIYKDQEYLRDFLVKLAERCGRYISYAEPLLDGTLPDGSRVHASLAQDVTTRGPMFSIRKFREKPFTPVDMIKTGTISSDALAYLWLAVQNGSNVLITGGTATGKTSILNALTMFIPPEDKIISIEDTRELNLPHQNWVPSVSRIGFGVPDATGEKYGEVTMFDLLRESFRQNPDYVIVGEVRGKEAYVMFQGMSSGHPSMATMHAGDVDSVLRRLITPPIELSPSLLESLDIVILMTHAKEKGASTRRVKQIAEIQTINPDTGKANINITYAWDPVKDIVKNLAEPKILEEISEKKGVSLEVLNQEKQKRKEILEWMLERGINDFKEVANIITTYYTDPNKVKFLMNSAQEITPETTKEIDLRINDYNQSSTPTQAGRDEIKKKILNKMQRKDVEGWLPFKVIVEKQ